MNPIKLITPSTLTPVTLTEAKAHLKVTGTDEDALVQSYLSAAIQRVENYRQAPVMDSVWEVYLRQFEPNINLQKHPVSAINSVKYYDDAGGQQTVSSSDYRLLDFRVPCRVEFDNDFTIPTDIDDREYPWVVNFNAGFNYAASAQYSLIKQVIFAELGTYHEIRQNEMAGIGLASVQLKSVSMQLLDGESMWL